MFKPQHQNKCYCNNNTNCCCSIQIPRLIKSLKEQRRKSASSTISTASGEQNTNFVKIIRRRNSATSINANDNKRGLGHSSYTNPNAFSRRSSLASTIKSTKSNNSPSHKVITFCECKQTFPRKQSPLRSELSESRLKPLRSTLKTDFTDRRYSYEMARQQQQIAEAENQKIIERHNRREKTTATISHVDDLIHALQQFRLQNPIDCFSNNHLNDLRLQQQQLLLDSSEVNRKSDTAENNNIKTEEKTLTSHLIPYTLRQRLLRLRLEVEAEKDLSVMPSKWYARVPPVDKSCALRYQPTY